MVAVDMLTKTAARAGPVCQFLQATVAGAAGLAVKSGPWHGQERLGCRAQVRLLQLCSIEHAAVLLHQRLTSQTKVGMIRRG